MAREAFAPPMDILAIQMRPDKSWSATVRKRARELGEKEIKSVFKTGQYFVEININ